MVLLPSALKRLPGVEKLLRSPSWQRVRHRVTLLSARRQSLGFTEFARLPTQLRALCGPVLDFVGIPPGRPLRIVVAGCSIGAEPYSIASALARVRPDVPVEILAFDVDPAAVERGRAARYTNEEATHHPAMPEGFLEGTFDRDGDSWVVKPAIRALVRFETVDALDPRMPEKVGFADVLFAQNFLFHLAPRDATRAFGQLVRCLAPRSAIFLDGCDLSLRDRWTRSERWVPLDFEVEAIHDEARRERGSNYPYVYWSVEPFDRSRADAVRRYSTIFLRLAT